MLSLLDIKASFLDSVVFVWLCIFQDPKMSFSIWLINKVGYIIDAFALANQLQRFDMDDVKEFEGA